MGVLGKTENLFAKGQSPPKCGKGSKYKLRDITGDNF
jgi:hypothetical protein